MYLVLSRIPSQFSSFLWICKHSSWHVLTSHFGHVYLATLKLHTSQFPSLSLDLKEKDKNSKHWNQFWNALWRIVFILYTLTFARLLNPFSVLFVCVSSRCTRLKWICNEKFARICYHAFENTHLTHITPHHNVVYVILWQLSFCVAQFLVAQRRMYEVSFTFYYNNNRAYQLNWF